MLVQTRSLIPHRMRCTMLESAPSVVNRLGRMDFSARTGPGRWPARSALPPPRPCGVAQVPKVLSVFMANRAAEEISRRPTPQREGWAARLFRYVPSPPANHGRPVRPD